MEREELDVFRISSDCLFTTETPGKSLSCSVDRICRNGEADPRSHWIVGTRVIEVLEQRKHVAGPSQRFDSARAVGVSEAALMDSEGREFLDVLSLWTRPDLQVPF